MAIKVTDDNYERKLATRECLARIGTSKASGHQREILPNEGQKKRLRNRGLLTDEKTGRVRAAISKAIISVSKIAWFGH